MKIEMKIGRNTYTITKKDRFIDNGACVQLTTQSKEKGGYGGAAMPQVSKKLWKEINAKYRVQTRSVTSSFGTVLECRIRLKAD